MRERVLFFNSDKGRQIQPLRAAVAMLVLLGVPWIFTAFGALNSGNDGLKPLDLLVQVCKSTNLAFLKTYDK